MTGKRAVVALLAALLAFGYVFTMNPGMVEFQIYPGARVSTSLALILFLFFLGGLGLAVFGTAFKEAFRSFLFWRHRKSDERREEAKRLLVEGRGHALLGRTKTARKLLQKAYRKTSGEALVALEMARIEIADGRGESAERRLKDLLVEDPRNVEVLSLLLDVYRARSDFEGQVVTLTRWLEADPEHLPTLHALRDLYCEAGNWSEATRIQERVLTRTEKREERSAERKRLSELHFRQAQSLSPASARPLLERLVREQERFAPAHAALGEALLKSGDRDGAIRSWIRGYQATGQAGLLLRAEEIRVEEGKETEMLKLYKKLGKKDGAPALLQARLLLHLERSQEALEALDGMAASVAETRAGRLLLGEALYRLRSYDKAAEAFRESAFGRGGEPGLAFRCKRCSRGNGRWASSCPQCGALDSLAVDLGNMPAPSALPAVTP